MTVRDCFNKAALNYNSHCNLQLRTGDSLLKLIDPVERAIDLGCGTGLITNKIKCKKLYALDISEKMLNQARVRLKNKAVTYLDTSFDNFYEPELDLACANMSLQWSDNIALTLNNIKNNLKTGGTLAFSMPLRGTFINLTTNKMTFLTAHELHDILEEWNIIHSSHEEINYQFQSLIDSLRSIKAVGANYSKTKKTKLISRNKEPHTLTYNIGYFVVKKI
jgi:malonyl-CoA O-methyltransferase